MTPIPLGILDFPTGAAGAYDLLETQVLTSSAASVTFTGLGSYTDYKHLQIRAVTKFDVGSGGLSTLAIQLNGQTSTSVYTGHFLSGDGSSVTSTNFTAGSSPFLQIRNGASRNLPTEIYATSITDILDFSNSSKNTTIRSLSGGINTTTSIALASGAFLDTSAITQLSLFVNGVNLQTGSRFSLYGIKGA